MRNVHVISEKEVQTPPRACGGSEEEKMVIVRTFKRAES
jgi:hypothetical protein